ncbi:hypothetical protein ACROYT_G013480 [Oculina patagonica]
MSQDGGQVRQVTLHVNVGYAKSVLGIIKVIQFVLCFEILWALLLVISAGLVQPIASYYGFLATTGGGDGVKRIYNPMMAAVVFGFFTFVAFFVDIVILIIKIVKGRQAVAATAANPTA